MVLVPTRGRPSIILNPLQNFGSKLELWCRGGTWTASGTPERVSSWTDKSGNGHNLVGGVNNPLTTTVDGVDACYFSGDGFDENFVIPDLSVAIPTSCDAFFVKKQDVANPILRDSSPWSLGATLASLHPWITDGSIYEGFANSVRPDTGAPITSLTALHVYQVRSTGTLSTYFNGNNAQYSAVNAFDMGSGGTLGRGLHGVDDNYWYVGHMSEVIILNTTATDAELNQNLIYLADRYASLPALTSF